MTSDRSVTAQASKLLTLAVFLGITVLLMWEYRVTRASQQSMAGRVAHQNEGTADLIMKAITRDMRGAQTRILANRDCEAPPPLASAAGTAASCSAAAPRLCSNGCHGRPQSR